MNPYPVLTKLRDRFFHLTPCEDVHGLCFWLESPPAMAYAILTPAEVLALADELKAFVAAQTQTTAMAELPSGDPT